MEIVAQSVSLDSPEKEETSAFHNAQLIHFRLWIMLNLLKHKNVHSMILLIAVNQTTILSLQVVILQKEKGLRLKDLLI